MGMCRFEAWGEVQSGCRCGAWILLCSALLCPPCLLKTVSVCTVQLSVCLCARAAATAAWASTVVCKIAALLFPLPS